jgi:hypothetical protein
VINGPVLHEMARSASREREQEANAACPDTRVMVRRTAPGMPERFARAWRGIWRPETPSTGGRRRHHVLLQHDEFEGW